MRKPYRVIVWGPGTVGGACLRTVISLPEFELVGVLARSSDKIGRDAGDLVGMRPTGVIVTGDETSIYALEADCVIHTPSDAGDFRADAEIIRLLESGKNVVTALPYHFPELRGPDLVRRLEAACQKGGSSFHASGSDPGFMGERLALTLTGLCSRVVSIAIEEVYECSLLSKDLLSFAGFGATPEDVQSQQTLAKWADNYLRQVVAHGERALGVTFDRIEQKTVLGVASEDFSTAGLLVKQGSVGAVTNSWTGIVDGLPFYSLTTYWYLSDAMRPFAVPSRDHWIVTVEGRPSARMTLDMKASFKNDLYTSEGDSTPAGMIATGVPLVQAIPVVCSHEPGIVQSTVFAHWMKDLRGLEARKN